MTEHLDFTGQAAVITGAGGGVGRAYALDLARRGAKVVVNDLGGATDGTGGSDAMANRVCDEIDALGGQAAPNYDSVATPEGGAAIVRTALDRFGRIDILISNAGILRDKTFAKLEWANLDAVLDVHLRAAFYVGQPAFRAMKDSGNGGKIMLTTISASGLFGNFGQSNYTAAKLGLVGLMRTLSLEGLRNNIHVNAVAPIASTRLTGGEDRQRPPGTEPGEPAGHRAVPPELRNHRRDLHGRRQLVHPGVRGPSRRLGRRREPRSDGRGHRRPLGQHSRPEQIHRAAPRLGIHGHPGTLARHRQVNR